MNVDQPLSTVTPTPAKWAQKQTGLGVKDNGYAGAQHYGRHVPRADLFTSTDE